MREMKATAAAIYAASLIPLPLPPPTSRWWEDRKPSGKDRSKVKAARKQRQSSKKRKEPTP